jgi:hypothetical protein
VFVARTARYTNFRPQIINVLVPVIMMSLPARPPDTDYISLFYYFRMKRTSSATSHPALSQWHGTGAPETKSLLKNLLTKHSISSSPRSFTSITSHRVEILILKISLAGESAARKMLYLVNYLYFCITNRTEYYLTLSSTRLDWHCYNSLACLSYFLINLLSKVSKTV